MASKPVPAEIARHALLVDSPRQQLYIIGGALPSTPRLTAVSSVYTATIMSDGGLSSWKLNPSLPISLFNTAAVITTDQIIVLGGYGGRTPYSYLDTVILGDVDPLTGHLIRWYTSTHTLPKRIAFHTAVEYDGSIYTIGGLSVTHPISDVYVASIEELSGSHYPWERATPLPTRIHSHATVISGNLIYVIGGYSQNSVGVTVTDSVYYGRIGPRKVIDWNSTTPLSIPLRNSAAAISGDHLYVIGGYQGGVGPSSTIFRATIQAGGTIANWITVPQEPRPLLPLYQHSAAATQIGRVYVSGGNTGSTASPTHQNQVLFTPLLDFKKLATPSGPVTFGDSITYTLILTNQGVRDLENLIITDTVHPSPSMTLRFSDWSTKCQVYSHAGNTITCAIPSLKLGDWEALNFTITIPQPILTSFSTLNSFQAPLGESNAEVDTLASHSLHNSKGVDLFSTHQMKQGCISNIRKPSCDADLRLEKNAVSDLVVAGRALTYTLRVYNDGPAESQDVIVVDDLPDGVTLKSATPPPSSITPLTWSLGSIQAGGSREIQLMVQVDLGTSGTLTNTAIVDSSTPDYVLGNNQDEEWTIVVSQADLEIAKIDSSDPITPGETLTYTLIITNQGPSDAQDVSVLDYLPPELNVISTTLSTISGTNPLKWNLDSLPAGISQTIQVMATVDTTGTGVMLNVAIVLYDIDPFSLNNVDEEWTAIGSLADLRIEKSDDPDPVSPGETLTYTLLITNKGPSEATDVIVTDTLPAGVCSWDPLPLNCAGDPLVCDLGTVSAGETEGIRIRGTVCLTRADELINKAVVKSDVPDSTPWDNEVVVTTTIYMTDLGIQKYGEPDKVVGGDKLTYTLLITNYGPFDAHNVIISDTLPADVTFLSSVPSLTGGLDPLTWHRKVLTVTKVWTIEIAVKVNSSASGLLINTASVYSDVPDPKPSNNCSQERTRSPVLVTNKAYICEDGRWCKESNTVINSQFTFYLPLVLKDFIRE
jgi:uncharacterized repeat protein (TIGR01451 family)